MKKNYAKTLCLAVLSLAMLNLNGQSSTDHAPPAGPQLVASQTTDGTCSITISGYDSYGDGWNSASIDIQINGYSVETFSIRSGRSDTRTFDLPSGSIIDFFWEEGSDDEECSFTIFDDYGNTIYTSSGTPVEGLFFSHTNLCSQDIPNAPTNFEALPDPNHGLSVAVSWTNPTSTMAGDPLTLTSITLLRGATVVHTITAPVNGANESFVDAVPAHGLYTYSVYATSADGQSGEIRSSAAVGGIVVMQQGQITITTCSATIYDNGGPNGDYDSFSNDVLIINPLSAGSKVGISGTYAIETEYDMLRVYDGAGTSGTLLNTYSSTNGGVISDVSSSGPLTLHFRSDIGDEYAGFEIFVSCVTESSVSGSVTILATGATLPNALVTFTSDLTTVSTTTNSEGNYSLSLMSGIYDIMVSAEGYSATIESGFVVPDTPVTGKDFIMTSPLIAVSPSAVTIGAPVMGTGTTSVTITNDGDGPLTWDITTEIDGTSTGDAWDLVGSFNASASGMQAVATDGNFIYLASKEPVPTAGRRFEIYTMDLVQVDGFDIPGVPFICDLTYDGQYFYGGAGTSTLYCLDLENRTLVGAITTAVPAIRHCTYDPVNDGFWIGNWTDLHLVDRTGAIVRTSTANVYGVDGTGYDDVTEGGPYLLFFAQPNANAIVQQYNIATDVCETTPIFDFSSLTGYTGGISGGAFIGDLNGRTCFFGNVQQNPNLIGVYSLEPGGWLRATPSSGVLEAGTSVDVTLSADASYGDGLASGTYHATAHFNSIEPYVGTESVAVTLIVGVCDQPQNLTLATNETDQTITVGWDVLSDAISYAVYVNGSLQATVTTNEYLFENVVLNTEYCFTVVATCNAGHGAPSAPACVTFMPTGGSINTSTYAIYPNPANDQVIVEGNNIRSISVVNLLGQTMEQVKVGDGAMHVINTSAYNSGVYIFRIIRGDGTIDARSIIVAH